jgi:cytochrome P450
MGVRILIPLQSDRLVVSDPRALQYLLTSGAFGRSRSLRHAVDALFGEGSVIALQGLDFPASIYILCFIAAEGEAHRRARAIMNPAFSAGAIRKLQPLFERTAAMVRAFLSQ